MNKENSGPGQSRNYGAERAKGEYLLILDSSEAPEIVYHVGYYYLFVAYDALDVPYNTRDQMFPYRRVPEDR